VNVNQAGTIPFPKMGEVTNAPPIDLNNIRGNQVELPKDAFNAEFNPSGLSLPDNQNGELGKLKVGTVSNVDVLPSAEIKPAPTLDERRMGGADSILNPTGEPISRLDGNSRPLDETKSNGEQFVGMGPMLGDPEVIELLKKMGKLMAGEAIDPADFLKKLGSSKEMLKAALEAKLGRPVDDHNIQVAEAELARGGSLDSAAKAVQKDPLVFDLNHDGDTNATVDQHGINVDGSTSTKWAEKGDGVLAFGDKPLDTDGGKYKDAMEMLTAKAQEAGIDTSKGFLDQADLKVLESKGLTMMVSNGDGTNQSVPPTQLGISQISLQGKAVNKTDSVGNTISLESSFVQNGQTHAMNDMWLNEIPVKKP
jgi:hypothetical protein